MDLLDRHRLDVPVAQAGMGGGLAGAEMAVAVAAAGGLGTLGLAPVAKLVPRLINARSGMLAKLPDRAQAPSATSDSTPAHLGIRSWSQYFLKWVLSRPDARAHAGRGSMKSRTGRGTRASDIPVW
jgi:NAD(P)H-dependent flavin oxidoreductase YrpB (nitropropane dioxygenase family)